MPQPPLTTDHSRNLAAMVRFDAPKARASADLPGPAQHLHHHEAEQPHAAGDKDQDGQQVP